MSSNNNSPAGIDPRGPRFGAGITLTLLTATLVLLLGESSGISLSNSITQNALAPATLLLAFITVVFAIGAFAGIAHHPYGFLFKKLIRPRLSAPEELEAPQPPTFAQLIGFVISLAGLILALTGIVLGAIIAVAFAFVAAFLNTVFGYCLGCQIYILLSRAGIVGRIKTATH